MIDSPSGAQTGFSDLYLRFENRFRGAKEQIAARLSAYEPFLALIDRAGSTPLQALDIGCGRGEWLALVASLGFEAAGVDTNAAMVDEVKRQGFDCLQGDALEHLRSLPADSLNLITAFHVVEHVPADYLSQLLREIHRVLAKGGCVILETPNPENLRVGLWAFYLDPTHQRPIPPPLLDFLVQDAGFGNHYICRMNGMPDAGQAGTLESSLHRLFNSGPDYASIGWKQATSACVQAVETLVRKISQPRPDDEAAILLAAQRTDTQTIAIEAAQSLMNNQTIAVNALASRVEESMALFRERNAALEARLEEQVRINAGLSGEVARLDLTASKLKQELAAANYLANDWRQQFLATQASTSWKVTAPLRALTTLVRSGARPFAGTLRRLLRELAWVLIRLVQRFPRVKLLLVGLVGLFPEAHRHLKQFVRARTNATQMAQAGTDGQGAAPSEPAAQKKVPARFEELTSVRMLTSASKASQEASAQTITFLTVPDDV